MAEDIDTVLNKALDRAQAEARAAGIAANKIPHEGSMATATLGSVSKPFLVT